MLHGTIQNYSLSSNKLENLCSSYVNIPLDVASLSTLKIFNFIISMPYTMSLIILRLLLSPKMLELWKVEVSNIKNK